MLTHADMRAISNLLMPSLALLCAGPPYPGPGGFYATMSFWTSANYINWSFVGNLSGLPPAFAIGLQDCSDFYPAPGSAATDAAPVAAGGEADRWVFGDNRGGAITGVFDRQRLTFTADRPQLNTGPTDR